MEPEQLAKDLGNALTECQEYKDYLTAREKLKGDESLYARVIDYRKRSFFIQNSMDFNKNEQLTNLMNENYEMLTNRVVKEYLEAEMVFCRKMQKINNTIVDGLDMDLDFLN